MKEKLNKIFTALSLSISAMALGFVVCGAIDTIMLNHNKKSTSKYEIGKCYKGYVKYDVSSSGSEERFCINFEKDRQP